MRNRRHIALVAVAAALAGCGGDDENEVATTTVTETAATPTTTATTAPEQPTTTGTQETTPEQEPAACTNSTGNEIEILSGDIDCAAAKAAAANYDVMGPRVQENGEWICEGGNAQTRPVIFTCTGPRGEFVVREPGG